ncbi:hypothetical protein [Paracoccus tegillarcae]|nr:hypothetical protein [Paracoccus tegillarcae]
MTNRIALVLALMIVALLLADHYLLHWGIPLFLAQQFTALVEWLSFWR